MGKQMTMASVFSGIGGEMVAAEMMGWDVKFYCEKNDFCKQVLNYWFPKSKSYDDITTSDFSEWRGKINVLTGGFPCFVAGTPVLTKEGFRPIEEIKVGDFVLSADNEFHEVEQTMWHDADKIVIMRSQGMYESIKCTPNHKFYIRKRVYNGRKLLFLPPEYKPISECEKGDRVGFIVYNGQDHSYTEAFWKLVGTYLADGWLDVSRRSSKIPQGKRGSRVNSHNHKTIICCGKHNLDRLKKVIEEAGFHYTLVETSSTYKAIICNKELSDFLLGFGKYAYGKHLTAQCFELDGVRKKSLLEGWYADGYKEENGNIKVTTVSQRLALEMSQLARDVYKTTVSISKKECHRECKIDGRIVRERPQFCITIPKTSRYGFYEDGFIWCNIKTIEQKEEVNKVYNLSVKNEHSYNVCGVAVHNCQPFSYAGQRRGASDDRYLWPFMFRCIDQVRPDWVVAENVAGITTMVEQGKVSALASQTSLFDTSDDIRRYRLSETFTLQRICDDLERHGYSVQPVLIPAVAVGAPHRRDRVFIVGHRNDSVLEDTMHSGFIHGQDEEPRSERDIGNAGTRDSEWLCGETPRIDSSDSADNRLQHDTVSRSEAEINRTPSWGETELHLPTVADGKGRYSSDADSERRGKRRCASNSKRENGLQAQVFGDIKGYGERDAAADSNSAGQPTSERDGRRERETMDGGRRDESLDGAERPCLPPVAADTDFNGHTAQKANRGIESSGRRDDGEQSERCELSERSERLSDVQRNAADAARWSLQGRQRVGGVLGEMEGEGTSGGHCDGSVRYGEGGCCGERWEHFPTVSPVCGRNDGLPFDVDSLTVSFGKWRTESLKAYGNAIVVQVMYEIFRAIDIIENPDDHTGNEEGITGFDC